MKKILGITLAAVLLGLLVSCGGAMASNPLCGKWESNILGLVSRYEFNGDASYKYIPLTSIDNVYQKGTWSTEGSTLTLKWTKSAAGGIEVNNGSETTYNYAYSVNGNTATIAGVSYTKK